MPLSLRAQYNYQKPFAKQELLSRINTHIELLKANRALQNYNQKLEIKVEERTIELVHQKEELQVTL